MPDATRINERWIQEIVLMFHGVGTPPDGIPEGEKPYWIPEDSFRAFIAEARSKSASLGVRIVATFDDGNRSDLEVAAPILVEHGIRGIFFPCTGRFEQAHYLKPADLRALVSMGAEIGSHGVDHLSWRQLNDNQLNLEVSGSKATIESIIERPIEAAAIPFGDYDAKTLRALRNAGYKRVYSSDPGFSPEGSWFIRRWSYHGERNCDLDWLVRISRSRRHRALWELKRIMKSLR